MSNSVCHVPDFNQIRGKRILVALSGGSDSVALLHMLRNAQNDFDLTIIAAHLDHAIRPESAEDACFCKKLCSDLSVDLYLNRFDVIAEANRTHEGLETAARRVRYAWLINLSDKLHTDYIALAHHMDDQAETVLMHLFRGAGVDGACGMRRFSGKLYRPLLDMRKSQIIEYLIANGLSWREDATNAIDDTPRNAIRLQTLPGIMKLYPKVCEALARFAASVQPESDYIKTHTQQFLDERLRSGPYGLQLNLQGNTPEALLKRSIRNMAGNQIDWETVNSVFDLCMQTRGAITIAGGKRFEHCGNNLYLLKSTDPPSSPVYLKLFGQSDLSGICRISASSTEARPIRNNRFRQVLKADALKGAVLRTRMPGDRFRPMGCGDRLLSDYLTDRKVDRPLRDYIGLVAIGSRILWVCGMAISEEAKLQGDCKALLLDCRYDTKIHAALFQ